MRSCTRMTALASVMITVVRERTERLAENEELPVDLFGRLVPVVWTPDGLRAVTKAHPA